jgi:predicted ATPase
MNRSLVTRSLTTPDENVEAVIDVCRRLDGIPLALKLAAARMPLFGLHGLASQLTERLRVLGGGSRNAPPRQQTLRSAFDWSYGLLSAIQQAVFRTMGVFVGGFTLELAFAVTHQEAGDPAMDEAALVDALAELVDRSFVVVDRSNPPRYQLLESAREYALNQLRVSGNLVQTQHHHAKAVLQSFQSRSESTWVTSDVAWLAACAPELDNLRAAIEWSMCHAAPLAVALMGYSTRTFQAIGLSHEHRRRSAELATHLPSGVDAAVLAEFWLGRAQSLSWSSYGAMYECANKSATLFRQTDDARGLYLSLSYCTIAGIAPPEECQCLTRWQHWRIRVGHHAFG